MRRELDFSLARSSFVVTSLWIMFGGGMVVAHQYFTRKTVRSVAAAALVAAATLAVQHLSAWDFLAPTLPENAAPAIRSLEGRSWRCGQYLQRERGGWRPAGGWSKGDCGRASMRRSSPTSYLLCCPSAFCRAFELSPRGTASPCAGRRDQLVIQTTAANALDSALAESPVVNAGDAQGAVTNVSFTLGYRYLSSCTSINRIQPFRPNIEF